MSRASELRHRVMSMNDSDCRQELADALSLIDELTTRMERLEVARPIKAKRSDGGKGVWERPGELGPNNCYPDPSDFD